METRTRARQAEEIRRVMETNEIEIPNDSSSDSENDNVEELEGSESDGFENEKNSNNENENDSSDDEARREAQTAKRARISRNLTATTSKFIYGKNRYKWSLNPPGPRSRRSRFVTENFGPCGIENGATVTSEGEAWSLLLPDELLEKIVIHTNERIARKRLDFSEDLTYTHDLDLIELKALLALLYFSGLQGSVRRNMKELYGKLSSPIYRATMPRQRFEFLLTFLRFDDKSTRDQRKLTDKLAPIREIWNIFINNCKSNFKPGKNVTIDEQLLSFRGRCAFRVYIRNKPDKYGLKIVVINDSETVVRVSSR